MSKRKRSASVSRRWPVPVCSVEVLLAVRRGDGARSGAWRCRFGRRFAGRGVDVARARPRLPPRVGAVHETRAVSTRAVSTLKVVRAPNGAGPQISSRWRGVARSSNPGAVTVWSYQAEWNAGA